MERPLDVVPKALSLLTDISASIFRRRLGLAADIVAFRAEETFLEEAAADLYRHHQATVPLYLDVKLTDHFLRVRLGHVQLFAYLVHTYQD